MSALRLGAGPDSNDVAASMPGFDPGADWNPVQEVNLMGKE